MGNVASTVTTTVGVADLIRTEQDKTAKQRWSEVTTIPTEPPGYAAVAVGVFLGAELGANRPPLVQLVGALGGGVLGNYAFNALSTDIEGAIIDQEDGGPIDRVFGGGGGGGSGASGGSGGSKRPPDPPTPIDYLETAGLGLLGTKLLTDAGTSISNFRNSLSAGAKGVGTAVEEVGAGAAEEGVVGEVIEGATLLAPIGL